MFISHEKKLGLLRSRPKYIHRGSKHGLVYSGSAHSIPTVWSRHPVAAHLHHYNIPHVCTANLKPLVCVDSITPPSLSPAPTSSNNTPTIMLLNTCSLNNKASVIHDIISDLGYVYLHKPHSTGSSGGLAVIHQAAIPVKQLPVSNTTSFECIAFSMAGYSQLQIVLIYLPPKASTTFILEFSEFLTSFCSKLSIHAAARRLQHPC